MEQARFWMWAKRKQCHLNSSGDSWEEQAFAEDSSGPLGGCIWPPRSYSCSFCMREFRSAQALGGHMNVHRRDRARLKQSPTPHHSEILHHHHQINIPFGAQYPPTQVCTSLYNTNTPIVVASSPSSPSRVSAPSTTTQGNHSEQTLMISPSYSSIILQEQHTKVGSTLFSPPPSWSDSVAVRVLSFTDSKEIEGVKNLAVNRSQPAGSDGCGGGGGGEDDDAVKEEEAGLIIRKRRRRDDASSLPSFLFNSSSVDRHHLNSMEDLDLELRLGDGPKVK
ncbi:hypothetical protein NE237_003134 [Protea cynaroides]|uniref:C2H2-type domain-containing protein n=1 Tax=Protea cynaroides TaxID=273540 RepID=A0A9Q0QSB0_9MAGN|nr:hypothetical protein NE237_003134 [Protea cynaroides]